MINNNPIGIFDSGVGGLTVVSAVREVLNQESIIYLGDTARVPYGGKDKATIIKYAFDSVAFLMSRGAKAVIMACNTSSALALKEIREAFPIPIFGVVEPGSKEAVRVNNGGTIGVLATQATAKSHAYLNNIKNLQSLAEVVEIPCPGWVELIESDSANTSEGLEILARTMEPLQTGKIDTVVLGCTHYPIIRKEIAGILDASGRKIELVDPAKQTAILAKKVLTEARALNDGLNGGKLEITVTAEQPQFTHIASRILGEDVREVELVKVDDVGRELCIAHGFEA
ncbi:MAG: glutamate racemase [Tissierellia bacterium]|nr:glutamate racemase [Tissierellia bacterium]